MDISAVIPFYHAEAFIEDAVQSVLAQTAPVKELIIINDSPSAESRQFLSAYESIARIIHLDRNTGISNARNQGVLASESEWIAFLDADDKWANTKLERQIAYLAGHPENVVCHTGFDVFAESRILNTINNRPENLQLAEALMSAVVLPSSMLVRRNVLLDVGMFDTSLPAHEDADIIIRILAAGHRIGFCNGILTSLRREGHGHVTANWVTCMRGHLGVFRKHYQLYKLHGKRKEFLRWVFQHASHRSSGVTKAMFSVMGRAV